MGGGGVVPEQMLLGLNRQGDDGTEQDGRNNSFHVLIVGFVGAKVQ